MTEVIETKTNNNNNNIKIILLQETPSPVPVPVPATVVPATVVAEEAPTSQEDQVEESVDVHFEPVMKLEILANVKTFEEDEDCVFKMYCDSMYL